MVSGRAPRDGGSAYGWQPCGTLSLLVLGPDLEALRVLLRDLIENVFLKELPGLKERPLSRR